MVDRAFEFLGTAHVFALAAVAAACVAVWAAAPGRGGRAEARLAALLALLLVANELGSELLNVAAYGHRWQDHLPLHLCRANALLLGYMLLARSHYAYEVGYFWAMAGSVGALLTPDLDEGFPHPLFFTFFAGHGLAVVAVVYATRGFGFAPGWGSIAKSLGAAVVFAGLVTPVNLALDTNYLYLLEKPPGTTLYDYLGPWPWYLLSILALAFVLCVVCLSPFLLAGRRAATSANESARV